MSWVALTLLSAGLIGISYIFQKRLLKKEHVHEFLTTYSLIMVFMMLPFLKYVNFDIHGKLFAIIVIKGFILTIASILGTKALKKLEISTVMPMMNLAPLFLMILSTIFLKELLSGSKIVGVLLLVSGTYTLQLSGNMKDILKPFRNFRNKYIIYIVIGMVIVSIAAMIDKVALTQIDFFSYLFLSVFIKFLFYTSIQFYKYKGFTDIVHALKIGGLWVFLICAIDLMASIFYFMAVATPGAYISLILPVKRLSTLFSTIIGGEIFHDHNLKFKIIACVLMLIGIGLIIL